jgi:class 3 adenylate cyclase
MSFTHPTPSSPLKARRSSGIWARTGLRSKITLPYVLLAIFFSAAGAYIVTQLIVDSLQERFANQLIESGRLAADSVVVTEQELLGTLRAVAFTTGVAEEVAAQDATALKQLALPIAVNDGAQFVEVIDSQGAAVLSLHRQWDAPVDQFEISRGGTLFGSWPVVERVLAGQQDLRGDKHAAIVETPWGACLYIVGPVKRGGEVVGAVAVGAALDGLVVRLRRDSAAHVTLYDARGQVLASTLFLDQEEEPLSPSFWQLVVDEQDQSIYPRQIIVRNREYAEVFGPFEVRGEVDLAVMGVSLPRSFLIQASPFTRVQIVLFVALALLAVIIIGTMLAQRITRPLLSLVTASQAVAEGDLEHTVEVESSDEVGVLAQSFNEMVEGLRREQFIRDAFGRAVSPEIVQNLVDSGNLLPGGEIRRVSILFSDIRGFTSLSEAADPQLVVRWLNEYLGEMTTAIRMQGGTVNKFMGDAILGIFGAPNPQSDHAQRALAAALDMKIRLRALNKLRQEREEVTLRHGIGISTGVAVAGIIGSEDRWEYTVIGDVVNVASRLEALTKQFPTFDLLTTPDTIGELESSQDLVIEDLGRVPVKGRRQPVSVLGVRREGDEDA